MRKILHVDMDAFYASIEERENPQLANKPVVVGGSPQRRGVVSAANYVARKFGVHSAMPMAKAVRLCPKLIRIAPRMRLYADVSHHIRGIFARYTPQIEPLALDEAFLDVTASQRLFDSPTHIAQAIKQDIQQELNLVASVGVAPNKFVAKIASDVNKPNGQKTVPPEEVDPLPVSRLWGAGKATVAVFDRMGIRSIGQLRKQSVDWLVSHFGKYGDHLWQLANGIDERPVVTDSQAKSISHETTFAEDLLDRETLLAWLLHLTEQVAWRLRRHQLVGKTITMKIRHADFKTVTRSQSMTVTTNSTDQLWQVTQALFDAYWQRNMSIRLIGMGVSGLCSETEHQQADLFTPMSDTKIDKLADSINQRFGNNTVQRGRSKHRLI